MRQKHQRTEEGRGRKRKREEERRVRKKKNVVKSRNRNETREKWRTDQIIENHNMCKVVLFL